jgi:hypothetical protein
MHLLNTKIQAIEGVSDRNFISFRPIDRQIQLEKSEGKM